MSANDFLDHDWIENSEGVAVCANCQKTFDEADSQEDPIICWAEPEAA